MKKLKLLGIKKGLFDIRIKKTVAIIYVENGRVVIESKLSSLLALRDRIQKIGDEDGFVLWHTREYGERPRKINDPDFLEALASGDFLYREFDGWSIGATRDQITEE
ncbi:MAG: hypothetical protein HYU81_01130 [Candidatus Brennerbacteria bacterium]|nr:hypothetical protein [Candidatus Brennerbacteria bacterium]